MSDIIDEYADYLISEPVSQKMKSIINARALGCALVLSIPFLPFLDEIVYAILLWGMYGKIAKAAGVPFKDHFVSNVIGGFIVNIIICSILDWLLEYIPIAGMIGSFIAGFIATKMSGQAFVNQLKLFHGKKVSEHPNVRLDNVQSNNQQQINSYNNYQPQRNAVPPANNQSALPPQSINTIGTQLYNQPAQAIPINGNLLSCPDCGQMVSRRAGSCPNCGCPVSEMLSQNNSSSNDVIAAGQGDANALNDLGNSYYLNQNYLEAVKCYISAANQGDSNAQNNLGDCYYYGDGVNQNYYEAVKWYTASANQGNAYAQFNLGNCYHYGNGVPQNDYEAFKWISKAAEQGYLRALYNLGMCYLEGIGVSQNSCEAVKWFKMAAEQGEEHSQHNLGMCYLEGVGVSQNSYEAVKWFRMAAEQGDANAQTSLGVCYYDGNGVNQNFYEAVKWYQKASEQGDANAQYNLGVCYYNGEGVNQDRTIAYNYIQSAAAQGMDAAIQFLNENY